MVVVPSGSFLMGSAESEPGRDPDESPQHLVTIRHQFAVGRYEVTRRQFAAFVGETGYQSTGGNCFYWNSDEGKVTNDDAAKSWRNPGFAQNDGHPVVCVSWLDAKAYVSWLGRKTGRSYRLLTEAEWEYAARAGSGAARPWGNDPDSACAHANVGDRSFRRIVPPGRGMEWKQGVHHECDDGAGYTANVGSYRPNAFGLYDMIGNAWEWVEDCYNESYAGAPADGSAWVTDGCARRVGRGASWSDVPRNARSARRNGVASGTRDYILGFRVSRTLSP